MPMRSEDVKIYVYLSIVLGAVPHVLLGKAMHASTGGIRVSEIFDCQPEVHL